LATLALLAIAAPGTVTDLTAVAATDSTVTLRWTEVPSNDSVQGTWYDVRWGPAVGFSWAPRRSPLDTLRGTSRTGGAKFFTTVRGLTPATSYTFQIASCVGVFGTASCALGNSAPMTTAATPPQPPPPPPPVTVRTVRINDVLSYSATLFVGGQNRLSAFVRDSSGTLLTVPVTWRSRTPAIATVDTIGTVTGIAPGLDTVTATAGSITSAPALFQVNPVPTPAPVAWSIAKSWITGMALLAQPPCVISLVVGTTTTCPDYPVSNDSTGAVILHVSIAVTVKP